MKLNLNLFYPIRLIIRFDSFIEGIIKKFIFKPKHQITGKCKICGRCCKNIGIYIADYLVKIPILFNLIIKFYEKVNDFEYQGYLNEKKLIIFNCRNFDENSSKCTIHNKRPAMCRNYPFVRYFTKPVLLEGCGYSIK